MLATQKKGPRCPWEVVCTGTLALCRGGGAFVFAAVIASLLGDSKPVCAQTIVAVGHGCSVTINGSDVLMLMSAIAL